MHSININHNKTISTTKNNFLMFTIKRNDDSIDLSVKLFKNQTHQINDEE